MIAIDTNILIYFLVRSQVEHERARRFFASVQEPLATTHTNIAEALRLLTHPRVFRLPLALSAAIDLISTWVDQFEVTLLEEASMWWMDLKDLASEIPSLRGNEVFDARIALCLRYHGVKTLCTLDADFAKYPFLKIVRI